MFPERWSTLFRLETAQRGPLLEKQREIFYHSPVARLCCDHDRAWVHAGQPVEFFSLGLPRGRGGILTAQSPLVGRMMKILVDADACPKPVLEICMGLGHKYGVPVWTVAGFDHHIESDHHVTVGSDPQEADIKVINLTEAGDIVVTQDWGLAAVVLGKGARCLSPHGREFRSDRVLFLLEEREVKAKVRRSGARIRGPGKRTAEDDRRFENRLERILSSSPLRMAGTAPE